MRRQRWVAGGLLSAALCAGILAGCAKKDDTTGTPPPDTSVSGTPAPTDTSTGEVSLAVGERVYQDRCVLCHGAGGKGDGVGAAALNPKPRNHTDHAYMGARSNEEFLEVIRNGKGGMPAWGGTLSESEIKSVLIKVRSLDPQYTGPLPT